jgi:hypothetical protein
MHERAPHPIFLFSVATCHVGDVWPMMRDWIRVTIAMDIDLNRRLKERQYELMKENNNISFSKLVNQILNEGLKNRNPV